ncbi:MULTISPECIES: hypothetical protein [Microbacterium]|uniref:hypothetical protein n=1 Tax=Microbacterium TaxID=33882 RepID=UPI00146DA8B4|nr:MULTISPECIES: hypothetical protein [Microbacterium]
MSADEVAVAGGAPLQAAPDVGLWRERWFRVLTILNISLVVASAFVAVGFQTRLLDGPLAWLGFLFPVVPVTVVAPMASVAIVLAAAAFSSLGVIVHRQKRVRFLRAFTVWGTIALIGPSLLAAIWFLLASLGSPT